MFRELAKDKDDSLIFVGNIDIITKLSLVWDSSPLKCADQTVPHGNR